MLLAAVAVCACDRRPAAPTEDLAVEPAEEHVVPLPRPLVDSGGRVEPAPWLHGAQRVAALRGDGAAYVLAAGVGWLRVFAPDGTLVAEHAGQGGAHALAVADLDGDGRPEVVVGRGVDRAARGAPASVTVYRRAWSPDARAEVVPLVSTARAQVVSIEPHAGALVIGAYDSKYMVTLLRAVHASGAWSAEPIDRVRVLAGAVLVADGLALARTYGDTLEADGYVTAGGDRVPSTRGARAILAVGADLVFTDGWHREYGKRAQALITRARRTRGGWRTSTLAHVAGRYGYDRLRVGDVDGDGAADIVAAGNGPAVTVPLSGKRAAAALGTVDAVDAFPFDLDGDGADEVVLAGETPAIWRRSGR